MRSTGQREIRVAERFAVVEERVGPNARHVERRRKLIDLIAIGVGPHFLQTHHVGIDRARITSMIACDAVRRVRIATTGSTSSLASTPRHLDAGSDGYSHRDGAQPRAIGMNDRWSVEQVESVAPSAAAMTRCPAVGDTCSLERSRRRRSSRLGILPRERRRPHHTTRWSIIVMSPSCARVRAAGHRASGRAGIAPPVGAWSGGRCGGAAADRLLDHPSRSEAGGRRARCVGRRVRHDFRSRSGDGGRR